MKATLLIICCGIVVLTLSHTKAGPGKNSNRVKSDPTINSAGFTATVQPILVQHCAPCHFPGGKMYEKMPFDKAETIIEHKTGVLRRLTGKTEQAKLEQFFANR